MCVCARFLLFFGHLSDVPVEWLFRLKFGSSVKMCVAKAMKNKSIVTTIRRISIIVLNIKTFNFDVTHWQISTNILIPNIWFRALNLMVHVFYCVRTLQIANFWQTFSVELDENNSIRERTIQFNRVEFYWHCRRKLHL